MELTFEVRRGKLKGEGKVLDLNDKPIYFGVSGVLKNGTFLLLEYENIDKGQIQFGNIILEFSPSGKLLNGSFVGFGSNTGMILNGTVKVEKVD